MSSFKEFLVLVFIAKNLQFSVSIDSRLSNPEKGLYPERTEIPQRAWKC